MSYFNTTNLAGSLLRSARGEAAKQEDLIFEFMSKSMPKASPSQVHVHLFLRGVPITSVRRAMTVLASDEDGRLEKTEEQREGPYGRPEHYWRVAA